MATGRARESDVVGSGADLAGAVPAGTARAGAVPLAWEVDLDAPEGSPPEGGAQQAGEQLADGWTPSGGEHDGAPPVVAAGARRGRRGPLGGLAAVLGLLLAVGALWPGDTTSEAQRERERAALDRTALLAGRLSEPVRLVVPAGLRRLTQGSYVSLRGEGGHVLVTTPTQVVDSAGRRVPLPDDPVSWLKAQRSVSVTRVRSIPVAGRQVEIVDYQLAPTLASGERRPSRFSTVSLFCGLWTGSNNPQPCSRISQNARVRSTFVPVGDRWILVEAFWRSDTAEPGRMPSELRTAYWQLLRGMQAPTARSASFLGTAPRLGS